MICPNCHSEIRDDALFCSECGQKIIKVEEPRVEKSTSAYSRVQNRKIKQKNNRQTMIIIGVVAALVVVVVTCYFLFFKKADDKSDVAVKEEKTETTEKSTKKIKLEESSLTLKVGETEYIEANMDCQYTVKDSSICEVDSFGTVKGLKVVKTIVTCKGENGTKVICRIDVIQNDDIDNESVTYDVEAEVKTIRELYNTTQKKQDSYRKVAKQNMTVYKENDDTKK